MKLDMKKIIAKNTSEDGVIDYGKVNQAVLGQVETHTEKIKSEAKSVGVNDFITNLKIKDVTNPDGLVSHLKNYNSSSDEAKAKITELTNQLGEVKPYKEKYESLNSEFTGIKNKATLKELGINSEFTGKADAIIKTMTNEKVDYSTAAKQFVEDKTNAWAIGGDPQKVDPKSKENPSEKLAAYDKIMKEKYGITRD